ncbi:hypothetical protein FA95DRAFT_545295 [Auriscalpium vulgare]|uniref:Uncharacterized protein n=1 Tax=Auriscalpium vulgare TaxID=40419 RepID=A0ACB8REZ1_9AGAM|nr:hypothetical protein FA95DRAFT_545295 [Auriscalpium vulgare]
MPTRSVSMYTVSRALSSRIFSIPLTVFSSRTKILRRSSWLAIRANVRKARRPPSIVMACGSSAVVELVGAACSSAEAGSVVAAIFGALLPGTLADVVASNTSSSATATRRMSGEGANADRRLSLLDGASACGLSTLTMTSSWSCSPAALASSTISCFTFTSRGPSRSVTFRSFFGASDAGAAPSGSSSRFSLSGVGVFERLASIALLWSRMYKPFCALTLAGDVVFAALWQALVGERLVHVRRRPTWVH